MCLVCCDSGAPSGGEELCNSDGAQGFHASLVLWTLTALIASVPPPRPRFGGVLVNFSYVGHFSQDDGE